MARQALIKLRRGTGAPGANVLAEGELAIDIAAKKLYSANSSGSASLPETFAHLKRYAVVVGSALS